MGQTIDIAFLELLSSKICHDLISPIGAIANGIEFLEEMGGSADDDVLDLLKFSSTQASSKLQAFRMAYGAGGGDASVKPEEVYKCFAKFIELDKKISQNWDPHGPLGPEERSDGFSKMLMCLLLLCVECLPKGGMITIKAAEDNVTSIIANGEDAALKPPMDKALANSMRIEEIEPRYAHAFMTGLMAKTYNYQIEQRTSGDDAIEFILTSPLA